MTLEELRANYPDEIAQVEAAAVASVDHTDAINTAVQAERERMQGIDEVAALLDPQAVHEAKYGENPCTAADLLLEAARKAAKQGKKFLTDLEADAKGSRASEVTTVPGPADEGEGKDATPEARMASARSAVSDLLGKKKEG